MTRLREQKLWDAMRQNFMLAINASTVSCEPLRLRLERVENMVGDGTPDVLVLCDGLVTWCELKAVDALPRRATTRVLGSDGLNWDQRNWHMSWLAAGGRSLIVIGIGAGRERMCFAVEGRHGEAVNDMTFGDLTKRAVAMGMGLTFWPHLLRYLKDKK